MSIRGNGLPSVNYSDIDTTWPTKPWFRRWIAASGLIVNADLYPSLLHFQLLPHQGDLIGRSFGRIPSGIRGNVSGAGLLLDFGQRFIHRVPLLSGIAGIGDKNQKRHNLNPTSGILQKLSNVVSIGTIKKTAKEALFLSCGIVSLVCGYCLVRVRVAVGGSILNNVGIRLFGIVLIVSAQWFL